MRVRVGLVGLLVTAGLLTPGGAQAAPVTLTCGDVVTEDVVLAADVECGPVGSSPGLIVGADDITIDLNSHSVVAPVSIHFSAPGIENDGRNGVTIRNGRAVGASGIVLNGASNNRLIGIAAGGDGGVFITGGSGNTVSGGSAGGRGPMDVEGSPRTLVSDETVSGVPGTTRGIILGTGSDNSVVLRSRVFQDTTGIAIGASGVWVVDTVATHIDVGGNGDVLVHNWLIRSPSDGIAVSSGTTNTVVVANVAAGNTGRRDQRAVGEHTDRPQHRPQQRRLRDRGRARSDSHRQPRPRQRQSGPVPQRRLRQRLRRCGGATVRRRSSL